MWQPRSLVFLLAVLVSASPAIGHAQDDPPASSPRCLQLMRIDRTESVGNRSILFYMRDGTIYQNELRQTCPGLGRGRPLMYRVVMSQLCNTDGITILEPIGFGGFMPTASCMLGEFKRIDEATVEALKATDDRDR
jgi:hypothetical protein